MFSPVGMAKGTPTGSMQQQVPEGGGRAEALDAVGGALTAVGNAFLGRQEGSNGSDQTGASIGFRLKKKS